MSNDADHRVSINILDKEYLVSCPEGAEAELFASASYLDKKMREIRDTGKVQGLERIAVMTALNISHDLLKYKQEQQESIEDRLQKLGDKIDCSMKNTEKSQPE